MEPKTRLRALLFGGFTLLTLGATGAYLHQRGRAVTARAAREALPRASGGATFSSLAQAPRLYYRSARDGEFGRVVVAALDAPDARRVVTELRCERVYFAGGRGICVRDNREHIHPPALASFFDRELHVFRTLPLEGAPSRARVSPNGRRAVTTVFVEGDSYNAAFSTRTNLFDIDEPTPRNLESFQTFKDGQPFRGADFNFWGVTFTKDSNHFFATLGTGGQSYLVTGDAEKRELRVLRPNAECPSLSPNQRRLAFKIRGANGQSFSLRVLELGTGQELAVSSNGVSVDDQVEWLDDDHLLYGIVGDRGLPKDAMSVWVTSVVAGAADGSQIFLSGASSPVVVR